MQDLAQIFSLSLLQGITEFLPISSSAHLVLLPKFMGWQDQGLSFDIAVHVGTLFAVVFYFRKEISLMLKDWLYATLGKQKSTEHSKLAWSIMFSTIPVGLIGILSRHFVEASLRSYTVIALTTIVFGLLLGCAAWLRSSGRQEYSATWKDIIIIGFAQAISLIPGTSRSGITMTAGMFAGFSKKAAARYSFFLAIPVIFLAGSLEIVKLFKLGGSVAWSPLILGGVISAISGICCIHVFLKLLNKVGFLPFVIYRLMLGGFIFFWFV